MRNIAIFASGTGSNARKIMEYFAPREDVQVGLLVSNKPDAPVLQIASAFHIPQEVIDRASFFETESLLEVLNRHQIDFIVLAGFLWKIPDYLVRRYTGRMVNIHPALLPKYGGKGMYGMQVHEAVRASGDRETGMTIHFVNEHYDEGTIIFQVRCPVMPEDNPLDIARRVQALEHLYYPKVIDDLLEKIKNHLPDLASLDAREQQS